MITIRPVHGDDEISIQALHLAAFPTNAEARLVALLSWRNKAALSLVAATGGQVVGHVLFSPISVTYSDGTTSHGLGLAPVAVLPAYQRRGIGSQLIRAGLTACREQAVPLVVVLGEPAYYNRFGFEPSSRYGMACEFGGGDAFQVLFHGLTGLPQGGQVRYASEFQEVLGGSADVQQEPGRQIE